jgi:UDP-glucose 4-epimerase
VLVTGGSGYIGSYFDLFNLPLLIFLFLGSHVIYVLQKTRRYKVISLDNNHNSNPAALDRVSQLSKSELPAHPTDSERESTEIDSRNCDLTQPDQIRSVFESYGKGGIWGVIHIAVSWLESISDE